MEDFGNMKFQSAMSLMKFADIMPGGFFIYRAEGNEEILYANAAALRLFNCNTMEEFREHTGNSFKGIVHPDDYEEVEESIHVQIANSRYDLDYVEYRIIQKGGNIMYVEDYGHFVHNEGSGDVFYVFIADATEKRKRLEAYDQEMELINQEQLRRLEMIEGLSIDYDSIFYVNLNKDRIKAYRVGSQFEKQFAQGNHTCEFAGFDSDYIQTCVYPEDRELLKDVTNPEFIRSKLSEEKAFHINYRIIKDGKPEYRQIRMVNVGSDENVSQIVLGYRDIDDEIVQEMKQKQILMEALQKANMANNAKNLFLSNMSHDIRTPMNAIVGFASLARKRMDNKEKALGYLDMILESSNQLLQLLNDVLEISRIESGKLQDKKQECDLMDVVHHIQTRMIPLAAKKNITISLDISNLKHINVYADQTKLEQLLLYIVDNSVKYTNQDGRITIMITEDADIVDDYTKYQFVVEDNGIGISAKFLEHIFEPFEREKNTTMSGIPGTGLGLTIVRELVNMMGGEIVIDSTVGVGSRFTITLPLHVRESYDVDDVDSDDDTPLDFSSKRILVVDDNEINLEIENEVLKDVGFLVDSAVDGDIAVEMVKQSQPGYYDLILMDIQMPTMDGYNATRAIRSLENPALAGIPIIAVSANTFEEDKKKAMESGMNAHLEKPLDTPRLYKLIEKFLKGAEYAKKKIFKLDKVILRPIKEKEYPLLKDFLYDAIYQPEGAKPLPKDIIDKPELDIYIRNFGKPDDFCIVAEYEKAVVGAVWARVLSEDVKGYGNIDEHTPEFAIAVKKEFRRKGIGWRLMQEMIMLLRKNGFEKASLSVNKDNYAYPMYRKLGFQIVRESEEDYLMTLEL